MFEILDLLIPLNPSGKSLALRDFTTKKCNKNLLPAWIHEKKKSITDTAYSEVIVPYLCKANAHILSAETLKMQKNSKCSVNYSLLEFPFVF